jgi:glycosyltransferase involved in cell wall biosynthesis
MGGRDDVSSHTLMRIALLTTDNRDLSCASTSATPSFGAAPAALLAGLASLPALEVHVIACTRTPLAAPAKLAQNVWFHGLHVPRWGWMRSGYAGTIRAVGNRLRTIRPDLVHAQGTERDCGMNAAFCGYPSLLTIHGHMRRIARLIHARPFSFYWLAAKWESLALRRVSGVLCLNPYTHRQVTGLNSRTWVVPNAVNEGFFHVQRRPSARPTVLCVANISPWKNQVALIKALDPLAAERSFTLRFIGSADASQPYDHEFLSLAQQRSWCACQGAADVGEVAGALAEAAMLVLPSLEENCPMVVLEAMAAGVPVAASHIGGIPDLIEDGKTGLLFDPRDQNSMRRAVGRVLNGPDAAQEMARAAREWTQDNARPEVVARRHLAVYQELLSTVS